jgi:hypothetical protein
LSILHISPQLLGCGGYFLELFSDAIVPLLEASDGAGLCLTLLQCFPLEADVTANESRSPPMTLSISARRPILILACIIIQK